MQSILVILTGSPHAWQAAFTGYELAVRGGLRLVAGIPAELGEGHDAGKLSVEFEIGARAAGATFSTTQIEYRAGRLGGQLPENLRAVLVGQQDLGSARELNVLLEGLSCPLWVIQGRRELSRALAIELAPRSVNFHEQVTTMGREWGWQLETVSVSSLHPEAEAADRSVGSAVSDSTLEVSQAQFIRRLSAEPSDLVLIPWPNSGLSSWGLVEQVDRPLIFVPST